MSSLHGGSLNITRTVPVTRKMFVKSAKGIDSLPPIPIFLVPISLKPDGVKEGIKKSEFVTMTQFLYEKPRRSSKPQRISKSMQISKV